MEELNKIAAFFEMSPKEQEAVFDDILSIATALPEILKKELKLMSKEEREKTILLVKAFREKMLERQQKLGFSDEELIRYTDNPANFSKKTWNSIQNTKVTAMERKSFSEKPKKRAKIIKRTHWVQS